MHMQVSMGMSQDLLNNNHKMKHLFILMVLCFGSIASQAQRVAINTTGAPADESSIVDISGTTGGLLIPRMNLLQRDAILTPAEGLMIYQLDNGPGLYIYIDTMWTLLAERQKTWLVNGNSGIDPELNFIGTTDNQPLRFRVNNTWAGEIAQNSFLGGFAGSSNTTGYSNTGFGLSILRFNTTGYSNTGNGNEALYYNTIGNYNTAFGSDALHSNTTGSYNTGLGSHSLFHNITGNSNTASGMEGLYNNTTGSNNTAHGKSSLYSNTTGYQNTALGGSALFSNISGQWNTACGYEALKGNSYGYGNSAFGHKAIFSNATGTYSTGIGFSALEYNTSGYQNTASGSYSMYLNTTGNNNTAHGAFALQVNESGSFNTAIGYASGTNSSYSNTISIGNNGYLNGYDNQAFIGNLSTAWTGGNVTWSTYSDARIKVDVNEDVKGLDFITRLRPVTYYRDIRTQAALTGNEETEDWNGKYDIEAIRFSGFLAQEVEAAAITSGYEFSGLTKPRSPKDLYTLSYEVFVVPLVKAVQEQQIIIENQNERISQLEQRLVSIENLLDHQKK